ncbi:MAG TPA: long-chain fatty acid--CoA ligase [Azospirillum sp.]|nr:long-chain fatty acid--CoA ligase [Azospirillum sp.]
MDLSDWIDRWAGFQPDKPALLFEERTITYAAFARHIARTAAVLRDRLGVRHGDRVAWLGTNSPEALALLFACARLGAIFLPLNWRLVPAEHRYLLNDAAPTVLFVEPEFMAGTESILPDIAPGQRIAVGGPRPGWQDWEELLRTAPAPLTGPQGGGYADPVVVCYTSGTTGVPKGAVLTQNVLFWNAVNSTHMHDLTSADRVLTTLPIFHVGGLNIQTLPALHAGATVVLHRKFDPAAVFEAVERHRATLTVLVPTQIKLMMEHKHWEGADLSSLRCITTGSTLVPEALIRQVHARGVPLIQVYGSTETAPIAAYQRIADAERRLGSTGRPAIHCAIRLVDPMGRDVAPGATGEILVRGPNVAQGYWNDEEGTQRSFHDGWFHTGDIGHFDEDGWLWVDGRRKDVIISGGENIYPAVLEGILAESPDVLEAAVVGRPDQHWGEMVVAVVVPRDPHRLTREAVLALFQDRVARYKHPREVVFVDRLPRNAMGKLKKDEVRRMALNTPAADNAMEPPTQ